MSLHWECRASLRQSRQQFQAQFNQREIQALIADYTSAIDNIIQQLWQAHDLHQLEDICCIAVGGYGRATLLPYSDIDLLILSRQALSAQDEVAIAKFLDALWDSSLEIGHNVVTLDEAFQQARDDTTIMTNMFDSRHLLGSESLFQTFSQTIKSHELWSSEDFFTAKLTEQAQRYRKYDHTSRNLEPDIKHGPGGLRDIQMILWLSQYHFKVDSQTALLSKEFLNETEYQHLLAGQTYMWRVAAALQFITKRRETRLLFEYQTDIAKQFSYKDTDRMLAVEQFMQSYYRSAKRLRQLNDVLLQTLREAIITQGESYAEIDAEFCVRDNYLDIKDETLFRQQPALIFKLFILLCQNPQLKGVRANTIRSLCNQSDVIDNNFRDNQTHHELFISLLRQDQGVAEQLLRLNRYDILGKYITDFGEIIGQMQYDLFHVYTVDHHSIITVRNILRFASPKYREQYPLCADIFETISKREVLLIAALFHDMGKGKGGDHANIGAKLVSNFCESHCLALEDVQLAAWLVENHLLLSLTAQRQDIYDPSVIRAFAENVIDQKHLDYLYCLTVADICATNPSLWNGWRDTLLRDLYHATKKFFDRQDKNIDDDEVIRDKKLIASQLLLDKDFGQDDIDGLWHDFPSTYFLRESPNKIARHSQLILTASEEVMVNITFHRNKQHLEIFVYSPQHNAFAISTALLANHHFNIVEARLNNTKNKYCLASYFVIPRHELNDEMIDNLAKQFIQCHQQDRVPKLKSKRLSREQRHFKMPLQVNAQTDPYRDRSVIRITSSDRPGLLALLSRTLNENDIVVHNAKITTMGDKVEDVFHITHAEHNHSLDDAQIEQLAQQLSAVID